MFLSFINTPDLTDLTFSVVPLNGSQPEEIAIFASLPTFYSLIIFLTKPVGRLSVSLLSHYPSHFCSIFAFHNETISPIFSRVILNSLSIYL